MNDPLRLAGEQLRILFQCLKAEQTTRIAIRDNSINTAFISSAAIATIALSQHPAQNLLLLAVPLITSVMFAVYLNQDVMITRLQRYFTEVYPKKLVETLSDIDQPSVDLLIESVTSWETYHRDLGHRRPRKYMNLAAVLMTFLGTSVAAILFTFDTVFYTGGVLAMFIWILDLILTISICYGSIKTIDI